MSTSRGISSRLAGGARIVQALGPQHHNFYREVFVELVRKFEFRDRPSRLKACFAWWGIEIATANMHWHDGRPHWLYEVGLTSPEKVHVADEWAMGAVEHGHGIAEAAEGTRRYWRGGPDSQGPREVISEAPMKVIRGRRIPSAEYRRQLVT